MAETMKKLKCSCKHEYQDELYGVGIRAFNPTTDKVGDKTVYRCTVCKKERTE